MEQKKAPKVLDIIIIFVGCVMVFYHLIATQYLIWGGIEHRNLHLALALALVFLDTLRTMKRPSLRILVVALIFSSIVVTGYIFIFREHLELNVGFIPSLTDWIIGITLTIVVIESARQAWGWSFAVVCIIAILYFFFGHLIPGELGHTRFTTEYVVSMLGLSFQGAFYLLSVSADYIFLFVVFGGILAAVGAQRFFIEVGRALGKRLAGGAAQTAVVSSAFVGMVMGQAVSNVAVTGAFTIPFMKKAGYTPEQAGAIEATASTGGQVTPPIMGESVFIMATFLSMAYIDICTKSFLMAFLFFFAVGVSVQIMAYKNKIPRPKEAVDTHELILGAPLFLIPLAVLFIFLFLRFTPMYAAFYTIVCTALLPLLRKETRPSLGTYVRGFAQGALIGAKIAVAVAAIGMAVQAVLTTGLGIKIAYLIEEVSGGNLFLALIITMFVSLLLGCGLPTPAAYTIVAIIVSPVLVKMGVKLLSAHMFVFWFAVFSALTPPIAFASMAGASLAGGNFMKTCGEAFRLAISAFILPYLIVYCPSLIMEGTDAIEIILACIGAPVALTALSIGIYGHFFVSTSGAERLLFLLTAFGITGSLISKVYAFLGGGLLLFLLLIIWQWMRRKRLSEVIC